MCVCPPQPFPCPEKGVVKQIFPFLPSDFLGWPMDKTMARRWGPCCEWGEIWDFSETWESSVAQATQYQLQACPHAQHSLQLALSHLASCPSM